MKAPASGEEDLLDGVGAEDGGEADGEEAGDHDQEDERAEIGREDPVQRDRDGVTGEDVLPLRPLRIGELEDRVPGVGRRARLHDHEGDPRDERADRDRRDRLPEVVEPASEVPAEEIRGGADHDTISAHTRIRRHSGRDRFGGAGRRLARRRSCGELRDEIERAGDVARVDQLHRHTVVREACGPSRRAREADAARTGARGYASAARQPCSHSSTSPHRETMPITNETARRQAVVDRHSLAQEVEGRAVDATAARLARDRVPRPAGQSQPLRLAAGVERSPDRPERHPVETTQREGTPRRRRPPTVSRRTAARRSRARSTPRGGRERLA